MNYGKTAYLKVLDVEKELSQISSNESSLSYFEIDKPSISQNFSVNSPLTINIGKIHVEKNKEICLQIKASLTSTIASDIDYELIINDLIVHSQTKYINTNETDLIILKTYTPLSSDEISVDLKFYTQEESVYVTLKSISAVIIGAKGNNEEESIDLRATLIPYENSVLVSYIDNQQLYFNKTALAEKTFKSDEFTYLFPAVSHCFCLEMYPTEETPNPKLILYYVDANNDLYSTDIFDTQTETFIDSNVDGVFSTACPLSCDEKNIAVYIKEGKCYYLTMRNTGLTSPKELPLPQSSYRDIRVVSSTDSEHIYIVATNENGSNYLLHSLVQVSTGKISEFLQASYSLVLTKYIDLKFLDDLSIENISLDLSMSIEGFSYVNQTIEKLNVANIGLECNLSVEDYEIKLETVYGVKLDKSILTGLEWASYTDEAENLEPAYMDFENDTFVDNGWTDRWPFNQIRPCLINDNGKITAYLDPNDYTKLEDGTSVDIESSENGYVMVEFPKIYYKIARDDDYIYAQICNKAKEGFSCDCHTYKGVELDKIYISAYINGGYNYSNVGFRILSNGTVNSISSVGYVASQYEYLKTLDGERYEFLPYNVVKMLQCLYLVMFRHTDSQSAIGTGFSSEKSTHTTGLLNQKGMYYGTNDYSTGVKVFGLEDIYGCRRQMMTGFYLNKSDDKVNTNARYIDVTNPNSSYHPDETDNYLQSETNFVIGSRFARYAIDVNPDVQISGFYGASTTTIKTNGFCDYVQPSVNASNFGDYGIGGSDQNNGIFAMKQIATSNCSTKRSTRLVYYPNE